MKPITAIALGISDGQLTRPLVQAGGLAVDFFETSGPLMESAVRALPGRRLFLHNAVWDWSLGGAGALQERNIIHQTLEAIARTRTPWLSVHLGFSAAQVSHKGDHMHSLSAPISEDALFRTICANVRTLAAAIPVPLILENLNYCPGGAYEHVCVPEFIASVLEDTGTNMLLDLAHALVSAEWLGMRVGAYLARLPLHRVVEVHVSGPRVHNGMLNDTHESLLEEHYMLLDEVLRKASPQAVAIEYQRDEGALREQLTRLREIVHRR